MLVDISKGELIDKITILEIKNEKITDVEKLKNIRHELETIGKVGISYTFKKDLNMLIVTYGMLKMTSETLEKVERF
jgi:hypothetical protein